MRTSCFSFAKASAVGAVACSLSLAAAAEPANRSTVTAPQCRTAPVNDGEISDPAWQQAGSAAMLETPEQLCHRFRVCWDAQNVYFAVTCPEPQMATILAPQAERDAPVYSHESVELFISPQDGSGRYFQLLVSAANVQSDALYTVPGRGDESWNGTWQSAVSRKKDGWQVEIAVPFATLGVQPPTVGERWGLNICRNRVNADKTYRIWNSWSSLLGGGAGGFHTPERFGLLHFGKSESAGIDQVCDLFPGRHSMDLTVWGANPADVVIRAGGSEPEIRARSKAAPGRGARVAWVQRGTDTALSAEVRDATTGGLLYNTGLITLPSLTATPYWQMAKTVEPSGKLLRPVQATLKRIENSTAPFAERFAMWRQALANLEAEAKGIQTQRLLAHGPRNPEGRPAYGIGLASPMIKIMPQRPERALLNFTNKLVMQAARAESASLQVVLLSPQRPLKGVKLTASELRADDGSVIAAAAITAASLGFVNTRKPMYDVEVSGWYPDPILTELGLFDVRPGDLHPVWYGVRIPADAKPGVYQGTLTVSPAAEPAAVLPVRLEVWDFTLPAVPSLPTALSTRTEFAYQLAAGKETLPYGRIQALNRAYDQFLLEHRSSPGYGIYRPNEWLEPDTLKQWADLGVSAFTIFYIRAEEVKRCYPEVPPDLQAHFRNMIDRTLQMARQLGIENRAHVYAADEVPNDCFPGLNKACEFIEKNYPGLLTLTTALDRSCGTQSELKSVRGFCPTTSNYDLETAARVRREGKQVWWYVDGGPYKPYANLFTEYPAIDARLLLGFMAYAYKPDGFLYWSMIYPEDNAKLLSGGPYTDWNPSMSGGGWNGTGHLIYPGKDGPITSIRMENWLDGLEDYEYCKLLEKRIAHLRATGKTAKAAKLAAVLDRYGKPGNEVVGDLTHYTLDPEVLEQARLRLARAILD
jgi:hypothetical protein